MRPGPGEAGDVTAGTSDDATVGEVGEVGEVGDVTVEAAGGSRLSDDLERVLRTWSAPDGEQEALRESFLGHLVRHPDAVHRDGPPEHFTVGCVVLDAEGEQVLLTLHAKARRWFQLGGHIEPGDASIASAALREAVEESGLSARDLTVHPEPVLLDRHELPGDFGRCTAHLDIRYAAVARPGSQPRVSSESLDLAWWPADALPEGTAEELTPSVRAARAAVAASPPALR